MWRQPLIIFTSLKEFDRLFFFYPMCHNKDIKKGVFMTDKITDYENHWFPFNSVVPNPQQPIYFEVPKKVYEWYLSITDKGKLPMQAYIAISDDQIPDTIHSYVSSNKNKLLKALLEGLTIVQSKEK